MAVELIHLTHLTLKVIVGGEFFLAPGERADRGLLLLLGVLVNAKEEDGADPGEVHCLLRHPAAAAAAAAAAVCLREMPASERRWQ